MMELLLTVCLLVLIYAIIHWRARLVESRAHPLPPAYPGLLPIIGHTHLLVDTTNLWPLMKKIAECSLQQGGVIYLKFGSQIYYCIADPEDALLVANTCLEKHFLYRFVKYWLGEGLLTGSGGHWHRHREMLKSNFSLPIINGYIEVFNSQSRALLRDIDHNNGKGRFYPAPYLRQSSLGTSYLTTFGKVADENFCPQYTKAADEMLHRVVRRFQKFWLHNDFIYKILGQTKKESELVTTVNEISDEIIHTKRSLLNGKITRPVSTYVAHQPLLDLMLEQHTRNRFTDQEIKEELHTTIAAAYHTTAHSLDTILVMIGSFPKVQEKIFEEIMQVLGTHKDVAKEDLRKLVYTEAVIKESLRMLPPIPVISRFIDRDVKLKNFTLRAGSQSVVLLHSLHRHPSWGPDADQFRPERWLDTGTLPTNNATDIAFSFGKRSCIGKIYAMTSLKITVAHMVRRYFITADHTKMQFQFNITLNAVSGHEITLERRS